MTTEWTAQRTARTRLLAGAVGGALGGLAFLPVMLLLQPTLWAELVREVAPELAGAPAELAGWLVHMAVLTAWGTLFAGLLPQRETAPVLIGALGWAFILAWFSALGWALETVAHAAYGAVLAGTLLYLVRHGSQVEDSP
jgi:hypothetical protein